ncbi:hypothetical protein NTGM5_770006 [Candidatus Nitrotoga sp. M5]|nr:hypothetical protein NTGM5_770006 [Candidatus Nitrotoga sp. M5]
MIDNLINTNISRMNKIIEIRQFFLLSLLLIIVCFIISATNARAAGIIYLPADYDGTTAAPFITDTADFAPICNSTGGNPRLPGLNLARAFAGEQLCPGTTESNRFATEPNFVLLIDDTSALSAYLINFLRTQNSLQEISGRQVVAPSIRTFQVEGQSISVLMVGEMAYRAANSNNVWFASLDGLSPTAAVAGTGGGGGGVLNRVDWDTFKTSPQYAQFVSAVRTMKANGDANDANSWLYWANIHEHSCPHSTTYFLAWHRGYIQLFEKKIQQISNNPDFRLPYWNYYANPEMPAEFTNSASNNPLYVAGRTNTNVANALNRNNPFAAQFVNFQRGQQNAFEPVLESPPHNQVHNIIGQPFMRTLQSPQDPIFWVHHANIDRLWVAWLNAGGGRSVPAVTHGYWTDSLPATRSSSGVNFRYAHRPDIAGVTMERNKTFDTTTHLAYDYDNKSVPTGATRRAPARPSRAPSGSGTGSHTGTGSGTGATVTSAVDRGITESNAIALTNQSASLVLPISLAISSRLNDLKANQADTTSFGAQIVLDGIQLTSKGEQGGFGYLVYLNLPEQESDAHPEENHFVGSIGPFEIATMAHEHGGAGNDGAYRIQIPDIVMQQGVADAQELEVSFIRINGEVSPQGEVIIIDDVRIESAEPQPQPFNNS